LTDGSSLLTEINDLLSSFKISRYALLTGYTLAYGQGGIFTNGKQSVHIGEIREINIDR